MQDFGSPVMADLDGQPGEEIATTSAMDFFILRYDTTYLPGWPIRFGGAYHGPCIGDLDGDGHLELIAAHFRSGLFDTSVFVFRDDGTTMPGWPQSSHRPLYSPMLCDLDRDGRPEVIALGDRDSLGRTLRVFRWDGSPFPWLPPSDTSFAQVIPPAVGDVNGDSSPEVLAMSWGGVVNAWRADGSDAPGFPVPLPNGYGPGSGLASADFEGDGRDEVLGVAWKKPDFDSLFLFVWNGDGSVRSGWPRYIGLPNTGLISIADIDGDGEFEILTVAGLLSAFHKDGSLVSGFPLSGFGQWQEVACVDIDPAQPGMEIIAVDGVVRESLGVWYGYIYAFGGDGSLIPGWPGRPVGSASDPEFCTGDADGDGQLEFSHITNAQSGPDLLYLWKLPGSRLAPLGWPMYGHDRWHTHHYGFIPPDGVALGGGFPGLPRGCGLRSWPNPSSTGSWIEWQALPESQLRVYDAMGRLVRILARDERPSGSRRVFWDGRDDGGRKVPSGVYFYRLQAGAFSDTKKMVLIR